MQEYKHVNELLADAYFAKNEPIWQYVTDQNVDALYFDGKEYIQWDFTLSNGKDIHFREDSKWLSLPGVLPQHRMFIFEAVQEAFQKAPHR